MSTIFQTVFVFTSAALMWQLYQLWMDIFRPAPVDPVIFYTQKIENKIDDLTDLINGIPDKIYRQILRAAMLKNKYVNLVLIVIALSLITYWLCKLTIKLFRKTYMSINSISDFRGESMVEGSPFFKGDTPDCQVSLYEVGTFGLGRFLGCGLRYKNILIAPIHVIKNNKEIGIEGKKSALVAVKPIKSALHTDVCYTYLPENVWSIIGTTAFKFTKPPLSSTVANCAGHRGVSSGTCSPSITMYSLVYGGSTVNGMSGAAYTADKTVLGMHLGRNGTANMGVTVHLMCLEIDSITWGEDTEDTNVTNKPNIPNNHTWNVEDIEKALGGHVDDNSWHEELKRKSAENTEWVQNKRKTGQYLWADDLDGESKNPEHKTKWFKMYNQGPDETSSSQTGVTYVEPSQERLGDIIRGLVADRNALIHNVELLQKHMKEQAETNEVRFKKIEDHIWPAMTKCNECNAVVNNIRQHVKNVHAMVRCQCKAEFLSMKALEQHQRDKHPKKSDEIEMQPMGKRVEFPESAVADDSKRKVTTNFLGQRPPSRKKSGKNSRKNSNSQEKNPSYQLAEALQPLLMGFQQSLLKSLQQWQQATGSQNSEVMRN